MLGHSGIDVIESQTFNVSAETLIKILANNPEETPGKKKPGQIWQIKARKIRKKPPGKLGETSTSRI